MSKTPKASRHGKRAPGQTTMSITLSEALKQQLTEMAVSEHRTLAAFVRIVLTDRARRSFAARNSTARAAA